MVLRLRMEEDRRQWHFDKSISLGNVLTILGFAATIFVWGTGIEKSVDRHSIAIEYIEARIREESTRTDSLRQEMRSDLANINMKLDRLIEGRTNDARVGPKR